MKTGVELIADERKRQIEVEGWTAEHDSEHTHGELAQTACCYADPYRKMDGTPNSSLWPWSLAWWKPTPNDRIRELVKAGALIAAEIDRLQEQKGE